MLDYSPQLGRTCRRYSEPRSIRFERAVGVACGVVLMLKIRPQDWTIPDCNYLL